MLAAFAFRISLQLFGWDALKAAYQRTQNVPVELSARGKSAYILMRALSLLYPLDRVVGRVKKARKVVTAFGRAKLDLETHRVFDLPAVAIRLDRPPSINVLVPAFSIDTISAGFFGVFAFAQFCARSGYHTRLVLFENFYFDIETFRKSLQRYPIFANLLNEVELAYVGSRYKPLLVSDRDISVATVWYSAYFAEKIRKLCGAKHFLYLVQDYEPAFHPQNSAFVLADNSYALPSIPWFSTEPLQKFFEGSGLYLGSEWKDWCIYNNACSTSSDVEKALASKRNSLERNFVFYCRPEVNRNLFHLGALAIIKAFEEGVFEDGCNWQFYGIGIGDVEIYLDAASKLSQLPRMSLEDYQAKIGRFDVGLSLMASPHPSLVPFDLAGSGALVVTNSFRTKTKEYFSKISENVVCVEPNLDAIVAGIREAVGLSGDIDRRLAGANISFPKAWSETWTPRHKDFLERNVRSAFSDQ